MDRIVYRQLHEGDIEFAHEMNKTEQWNDTIEDLTRLLEYEPDGCFLAELNGIPIGHVFSISYGKLGWIGLLIVRKTHRRMGIGRALMIEARRYLLNHGVETIKLEAVPEISELYREIGFVNECDSLRFKGTRIQTTAEMSQNVVSMNEEMIDEVARFDATYFGAERKRILRKLHQAYPQLCFVSCSESKILGYIMCRKAEAGHVLGPWVCVPERNEVASPLLNASLMMLDREDSV